MIANETTILQSWIDEDTCKSSYRLYFCKYIDNAIFQGTPYTTETVPFSYEVLYKIYIIIWKSSYVRLFFPKVKI